MIRWPTDDDDYACAPCIREKYVEAREEAARLTKELRAVHKKVTRYEEEIAAKCDDDACKKVAMLTKALEAMQTVKPFEMLARGEGEATPTAGTEE